MTDILNVHFPESLTDQDFELTIADRWAHPAFFNETHESHNSYALTTLGYWIMHSTRFRHVPTGTWRGGPRGVRWPLAVLAGLVTNLIAIEMEIQVPDAIKLAADEIFQKRAWTQIAQLVQWMIRSVDQSIEILSKTYDQRAAAWQENVLAEYQRGLGYAELLHSTRSTPAMEATSGLPSDPAELHAYAQKLIQQRADHSPVLPVPPCDVPLPKKAGTSSGVTTTKRTRKPKKQSSHSGEDFDLDDISSTSEDPIPSPVLLSPNDDTSSSGMPLPLLKCVLPTRPTAPQVLKIPMLFHACMRLGIRGRGLPNRRPSLRETRPVTLFVLRTSGRNLALT